MSVASSRPQRQHTGDLHANPTHFSIDILEAVLNALDGESRLGCSGAGAKLARENRHHRRPDRCRRRQRRHGPHHCARPERALGQTSGGRQQGRRQRCHCGRTRRPRCAGRLHHHVWLHRHPRHQPGAAKTPLRPGGRLRADRHGGGVTHGAGGEQRCAGQKRQRAGAADQVQARHLQLRHRRQRHGPAHRRRTLQAVGRLGCGERALQRLGPRRGRHHCRQHAVHVSESLHGFSTDQGRQAESPRHRR